MVFDSPGASRLKLLELGILDLLGPADSKEEVGAKENVRPVDRYLVGMLAPKRARAPIETEEEFAESSAGSTEEGATEPATLPSESTLPSSLGLTFSMGLEIDELIVEVSWGRYERTESETAIDEKTGNPKRVWKRMPVESGPMSVRVDGTKIEPFSPCPDQPEVVIRGVVRERDDHRVISLFLVNGQEEPDKLRDAAWLFQVEMSVWAPDGSPVFIRRHLSRDPDAAEPAEMAMLYRKEVEFAVGHGTAVHAEIAKADPWRAVKISTRALPMYEVPKVTPPTAEDPGFERLAGLVLDMKELALLEGDAFPKKLGPLVDTYRSWIDRERAKIDDPKQRLAEHRVAAERALENCERTLKRVKDGIALLKSNKRAAEAFRFANRAMHMQRIHSLWTERRRRGDEITLEEVDADVRNHSWYPFQLAFILLNLPSATDLHHPDRSHETGAIADLLWFPTGGGKTEAYLGLTAYVVALRRLQGVIEGHVGEQGITVLTRYTLRLLTLQQFQRATALMCACETIRREDTKKWGETPFRIGLWVGMGATPNTIDQAEQALHPDYSSGKRGSGGVGTPAQLPYCPWCGTKIEPKKNIRLDKGRKRVLTFCGDVLGRCLFTEKKSPDEGLPILVTDEEIYRLLPSVLVATVDKFAQLPWNGKTQMLFGRVNKYCPRHGFRSPEVEDKDSHPKKGELPAVKSIDHPPLRPPDLIIQDELHLISGPLGSLVGLYETAVDELCSWEVSGKRVRPKVIASTATIRNARAQVKSLFLRNVEVFPPPGTCVDDNFFSIRREPSPEHPGRLYVGLCAPGKRLKAVLIRVYVALLGAAQKLYLEHGKDVDPWMTLTGYFNSLRELGGMRRLVDDDVKTRLRGIEVRGLASRRFFNLRELTSRVSSSEIPDMLDLLEVGFDPEDDKKREEARKARRRYDKPMPVSVLLATNMLSVGVDIKRLGLMVVAGQPKATAEYIQATSRVGRSKPGLVMTVYNWARPRDLSHYERFEHYHATFYEQVESLSVTPFSARALDRGLSALLVAVARLSGFDLNENTAAAMVDREHPAIKRALDVIAKRVAHVLDDKDKGAEVRDMLEARLDHWLAAVKQSGGHLGYKPVKDGVTAPLLSKPEDEDWQTFTCLNSLRDVEPQSAFVLIDDATYAPVPSGGEE